MRPWLVGSRVHRGKNILLTAILSLNSVVGSIGMLSGRPPENFASRLFCTLAVCVCVCMRVFVCVCISYATVHATSYRTCRLVYNEA